MGESRFILPRDLDFECTNCGRCCRDRWEIRVDAASAEKLLARDWGLGVVPFKKRLPVAGVDAPATDELGYTVERKSCGSCVFLDAGNLCRIHAQLGLTEKPQVCQQFPYLFTDAPDGVTVGLSHYCPGVKRRPDAKAPPLANRQDELARLHAHALRLERVPDRVALDDGLDVAFADYVALEELLREIVLAPGRSVPDALGAAVLASAMLVEFLGTPGATPALFVAGWRRKGLDRMYEIAGRQRAAPRTGRLLLRQFLSLVDVALTPSSATGRAASGGWAFVKELIGFGSVPCAPLGERISVRAVRAVALPWDETAEPLRRYAEHVLFRRRLLPVLGVRVGLALLVLHVASMRYVARAHAARAGRDRANAEDVAAGLQLVEKHYAVHSSLVQAFATGPARSIFRRIAGKPRYALAVLGA